jgi:hypothetical protein
MALSFYNWKALHRYRKTRCACFSYNTAAYRSICYRACAEHAYTYKWYTQMGKKVFYKDSRGHISLQAAGGKVEITL